MIPDTHTIKKSSLASLKHKWTQAIAASGIFISMSLISMFLETLIASVFKIDPFFSVLDPSNWNRIEAVIIKLSADIIAFAVTLILIVPLNLGVFRWFWRLTLGADDSVANVFYFFSNRRLYLRSLSFYLLFISRVFLIGFFSFLPAYISEILLNDQFYRLVGIPVPEIINTFYALPYCLYIVGLVFFIPLIIRYFPAPVLLFSDEQLSPNQVYRTAAKISSGRKIEYASLILSFFGWLIVSLLGVTIIFTLPYFLATVALYSSFVVNEYNYERWYFNNYQQNLENNT